MGCCDNTISVPKPTTISLFTFYAYTLTLSGDFPNFCVILHNFFHCHPFCFCKEYSTHMIAGLSVNDLQVHTVYSITDIIFIIRFEKKRAFAVKSQYKESMHVTIMFCIMKYPCNETH
jgi:hypothetical protein